MTPPWQMHGNCMATARQMHGNCMATAWQMHGRVQGNCAGTQGSRSPDSGLPLGTAWRGTAAPGRPDTPWTPSMVKTTGKKSIDAPTGASTPTMVKTAGKKSKGAPTGASTPSKGAPQRKSFLLYKFGKKGERTNHLH